MAPLKVYRNPLTSRQDHTKTSALCLSCLRINYRLRVMFGAVTFLEHFLGIILYTYYVCNNFY